MNINPESNFNYSAELTEMALIGVLSQRFGGKIDYDAEKMQIINRPELNKFLSCLLYTSPSPRDPSISRMPSSA